MPHILCEEAGRGAGALPARREEIWREGFDSRCANSPPDCLLPTPAAQSLAAFGAFPGRLIESSCRTVRDSLLTNATPHRGVAPGLAVRCARARPELVSNPSLNNKTPDTAKAVSGVLARREGFEPPAFWSVARRSIQLS